jgi:PilZ domain
VEQERRRTPRYPFTAHAEVLEAQGKTPIKCRVSELSLNGCFVTTSTTLEKGTPVAVKINTENDFFEAHGSVAYIQPDEGMGLMFLETKPYFLNVLKKWVLAAMLGKGRPSA